MQIGELARRTGSDPKTIRYYESIGIMPPPRRTANGYRAYDGDAVERLEFVRDAQASGLSLAEIASVLELRNQGESTCGHVIELLERHLAELDRRIELMRASRVAYADMITRAKAMDPSECTDPGRCQTIAAGLASSKAGHDDHANDWRRAKHA